MKSPAQLRAVFADILDNYDTRINPAPADGSVGSTLKHYANRLLNSQKFFCGAKGRSRSIALRNALKTPAQSGTEFLTGFYQLVVNEFNSSVSSWLSKQLLEQIAVELGVERMVINHGLVAANIHANVPVVEQDGAFYGRLSHYLNPAPVRTAKLK